MLGTRADKFCTALAEEQGTEPDKITYQTLYAALGLDYAAISPILANAVTQIYVTLAEALEKPLSEMAPIVVASRTGIIDAFFVTLLEGILIGRENAA